MEKPVCLPNHTVFCPLCGFQLSCDLTFYLMHKPRQSCLFFSPCSYFPSCAAVWSNGKVRMTAFVLIASALLMQIAASLCELLFSRAAGWHWCMPPGIYNPRDTWYFMIKETDLVSWCWGIHSIGQPDGRIHLVCVWGMNKGCGRGEAGTAPTASWHGFPPLITGANFLCWLGDFMVNLL